MANPKIHAHYATPAEAAIMAAVDSVVDHLSVDDVLPLIDYKFVRDYTVMRIHARLSALNKRSCTKDACACVGVSRYYFRDNHIAFLKFENK